MMAGVTISKPIAECIYYGIGLLYGSKEHGTSKMLGHIPKCLKHDYILENDPSKKKKKKKILKGSPLIVNN